MTVPIRTKGEGLSSCPCCQFSNTNWFLPTNSDPSQRRDATDGSLLLSNEGVSVDLRAQTVDTLLSPSLAWQSLCVASMEEDVSNDSSTMNNPRVLLFDTHSHAHLEREESPSSSIYSYSSFLQNFTTERGLQWNGFTVRLISCSVEPSDWDSCLEYASQSTLCIPALGVHPWYIESILTVNNEFNAWFERLEALIRQHPGCMVGEIGLCKMARFVRTYEPGKVAALSLQRDVFRKQLLLAAQYHRPVSVHCVSQHGVLLETLQSLDGTEIPPVIALHSYTGTEHHMKRLLQWEASVGAASTDHPIIYFGISHAVNFAMSTSEKSQRQGREMLRAVPRDRLLIESDVSGSDLVRLGTAGAAAYVAMVWQVPLTEVATVTAANALRFIESFVNMEP